MPVAGHKTAEGQRCSRRLAQAQRSVEHAQSRRDELAHGAIAAGVGVRGVAAPLGIDKATVSRRYGTRA